LLEFYRDVPGFPLDLWDVDLGAERYLRDGTTFPDEIRRAIRDDCAAVLIGALGDPRVPGNEHARDILFGLRFGCDLYANIRPVRALADRLVPLKGKTARDVDFVVFRENTEGIYAGVGGQFRRGTPHEIAINEDINTRLGVERIIRAAFEHARQHRRYRVHMADKSNAMRHAHELWLRVFEEVGTEYSDVEREHVYVDALCLRLVQSPEAFQVIVTGNLFGDILSDLASILVGGLGIAPSANRHPGKVTMYEPVHGSAPPLVGKDVANPMAAILSLAMMLEGVGEAASGAAVERAVRAAVSAGIGTPDIGGTLGTRAVGDWIAEHVRHG